MIGALSLDQLRVFVAICDHGGFAAAGRALGRVQSAISLSVRTLENVQQVALFDQVGRNMQLSAAGKVLLAQARQVLRQADIFEQIAASVAIGLEPRLDLVVDCFVPTRPVVEALGVVGQTYPGLSINLFSEGLWAGQRRIRDGSAALAIGLLIPTADPDIQAYPLYDLQLVPVVAATHPLAAISGGVARTTLQQHTQLVLTDPYDATGPSYGVISDKIWRFGDMERRIQFLEEGLGWANIPDHLALPRIAAGRLKALVITDSISASRPPAIHAFHERAKPLARAAQLMLMEIRARLANL